MDEQSPIEDLRTNGFTILRSVIPREQALSIGEEVSKVIEDVKGAGSNRGYLGNYLAYDQSVVQLLQNRQVIEFCECVLGERFRISMITGTVHRPEMTGGDFHRDWPHNRENAFYVPCSAIERPVHLVAIWMLSDFSKLNGGTILVPGSHLWPEESSSAFETLLSRRVSEARQAVGVAGSVLILDARLLHAISGNESRNPRVALICRYAASWLNLETLNPLSLERDFIVDRNHGSDPFVARLQREDFDCLSDDLKAMLYPLVGPCSEP